MEYPNLEVRQQGGPLISSDLFVDLELSQTPYDVSRFCQIASLSVWES